MKGNDLIGDIPERESEWAKIAEYCNSFDGYEYWGSTKKVAEVARENLDKYEASGELPESIEVLRTILFYMQRQQRNDYYNPTPPEEEFELIRKILNKLREIDE